MEKTYWNTYKQVAVFRHFSAKKMIQSYGVKTILDVGSGDGLFIHMIESDGTISGIGFELSEAGIKNAEEIGVKLFQKDILDEKSIYDYRGTVDAVTCLDVLEHLFEPKIALKNMKSITKKYIIFSVPNFNSITARIQVLFGKIPENNTPRKGHCYWFNKRVIESLCSESGLEILKIESNTLQSLHKIGIGKFLLKFFPELFALSFTVLCKKIEEV